MLKIKLARFGKRNQPEYRIVVNEARSKRDGAYVAKIGRYSPTREPKILELDIKEYNEWVKKGAQPTDTVASLAKRFQSDDPFPKKNKPSKKAKAKLAAEAEAKAEAKSAPKPEPKAEPEAPEAVEVEAPVEAVAEAEVTEKAE
ncbi:MAG: 30S ribosomal protein S16 [Microgenomates group bacterium]